MTNNTDYLAKEKRTILAIEDEDIIMRVYERALPAFLECNLITAKSGASAIKAFKDNYNSIDAIISDFDLGDMTAEDVFGHVRKIKDIPFVLVTGTSNQEGVERILKNKGTAVLEKPVEYPELRSTVNYAFGAYEESYSDSNQ